MVDADHAQTSTQAKIITCLKESHHSNKLISIYLPDGELIGSLVPITFRMADDPQIVEMLCRWRKENLIAFYTVVEPTHETTRTYLKKISLLDSTRILFFIETLTGTRIGNIGFCNIKSDRAELDNVIRAELVGIKNFMLYSEIALLHWAFQVLKINLVFLSVLSDNIRAIRLYQKVGFSPIKNIPLERQTIDGGYRLIPKTPNAINDTACEKTTMEITKDFFYTQHDWLRE